VVISSRHTEDAGRFKNGVIHKEIVRKAERLELLRHRLPLGPGDFRGQRPVNMPPTPGVDQQGHGEF